MTTIDLSRPTPKPTSLLDALPRRVALTLPELELVAARAGGAPLPFDVTAPGEAPALESRLGTSRGTTEDQAYLAAVASLHDPAETLARRGLLVGDSIDDGLAGAVGLLATPTYAVEVDVVVEGVQVKAWHRASGDAVATLATSDGIVFELAWFPTSAWPAELARIGVLPEELAPRESMVPDFLDLPYELADAAVEAAEGGRSDLLAVLTAQHDGAVRDRDGRPVPAAEVPGLLQALGAEAQGRLRVLVADVSRAQTTVVGVRSWVLLADGWRTLRPHHLDDGTTRVELRAIEAGDLAADLAPVLAEVAS
ncbi:hypothetical protein [Nocardioides sp.]|uniref:hypothetical protein n=1 Tax=Nocardioides sp. TaxID=35761 RepID=UPI0027288731|nr:hypothetical protein [Nocardioides sp.]MDO9457867.1 hypothetical protein [Nocardioides sp.]